MFESENFRFFFLSTKNSLTCTLGARGFSCAVSGFGQVLKSDPREKLFFFSRFRLRPTKGSSPSRDLLKKRVWKITWFGEPGGTPPPRIPRSTPPGALPRSMAGHLREGLKPTKTSLSSKMASTFRQGSEKAENALANHWGQLIFTHDSKPPVLISKEVVRLGRKEG